VIGGGPEPYRREDAGEVAELWYSSALSAGAPPCSELVRATAFEPRLRDESWTISVVREGSSIVAFIALDHTRSILAQLFVAPSHQRRGTGKRLLDHAKAEMRGGFSLRTEAGNSGSRRFYERNGLVLQRVDDGRAYYCWRPAGEVR